MVVTVCTVFQVFPHLIVRVHCEIGGGVSVFQGRNHTGTQHLFDPQSSHSAHAATTLPLLPHCRPYTFLTRVAELVIALRIGSLHPHRRGRRD